MRIKTSKGKKITYSLICVFVLFALFGDFGAFGALYFFCAFVRVKSYHEKKKFKTVLMTSFIFLPLNIHSTPLQTYYSMLRKRSFKILISTLWH